MKKILVILMILCISTTAFAQLSTTPTKVKDTIIAVKRIDVEQGILNDTKNKSKHSIKDKIIVSDGKIHNYSYCDFKGATLIGKFIRSNFSFSINLDKAIIEDGGLIECNLSYADLPDESKMVNCNTARLESKTTDELDRILECIDSADIKKIKEVIK